MKRNGTEEGLLEGSTNFEAQPNRETPSGNSATPLVVVSTMVALCGSLCTGCAVSYYHIINCMTCGTNNLNNLFFYVLLGVIS